MYGDSAIVLSGCSAGRSINRRADVCSLFNLLNPAKFPHFERVLETLSHLLSMRVGCGSCLGCKRPRVQIPAARPSNPFEISCIGRSGSLGSLFIPAQFPHNPSRRLTGRADSPDPNCPSSSEERQLVRNANVFAGAESQSIGIIEMPILHAQHAGTGGNRCV